MTINTVCWLAILLTPTLAVQQCTSLVHLKGVDQGKMLLDSQITNKTMPGIMTCSRACLSKRRCKSFNFNMKTRECQLNSRTIHSNTQLMRQSGFVSSDISLWPERLLGVCSNHTCPLNSYCDPVTTTHQVCKVTGCLGNPAVEYGHCSTASDESSVGAILTLFCNRGYMPQGEVVCQADGTWSSSMCVSVSSCSTVKQYQPDSEDGEYWLRLPNFDNYITRIYCHDMSTSAPREFLTLSNINYGIYPNVSDHMCRGHIAKLPRGCAGKYGEVWFSKIQVNITTMEVSLKDRTFANISHHFQGMKYGTAFDCYTHHPNKKLRCGTKGRFTIDLRGTGWRISEDQQWKTIGFMPIIEDINRQMEGSMVKLKCGGYDGGCHPSGGLFLTPFSM